MSELSTKSNNGVKRFLRNKLQIVFPAIDIKLKYFRVFGKKLDLNNPDGLNEKILWLLLNWRHPLLVKCADKYRMREYVKECGLEHLLPQLFGVYSNSTEINWEELPQKFVLKCNNGNRKNIICTNKDNLDKIETSKKIDSWLENVYGYATHEKHYSRIKTQVICEEYIESNKGETVQEYSIYCFNGIPKVILVYAEGTPHSENKREFYDINWEPIELGYEPNDLKAKKPPYLDDLFAYCKKLSKPFPFVRIDFYALDNKPVLGELTFTSGGGLSKTYTPHGNKVLGDMLVLPEKYKGNFS